MTPIKEMIQEFLIRAGLMKRKNPVAIEPILGGIQKLKAQLEKATEINQELAETMKIDNEVAAKEFAEIIRRMKAELATRTAVAEETIDQANAEAKKAEIVVDNIATLTTKRIVVAE